MITKPTPTKPIQTRLERLQGFLEQDPDNLNLLAETADEAIKLGETGIALSAAQRILELHPNDNFSRLRLSSIAIAERNFAESLAITSALISEGLIDPAIRYNHAFALASTGEFADAKNILLSLHAERTSILNIVPLLIRCCHYLGELEQGVVIALDHMESSPQDSQVAGMLSLLYFDLNDLEHAGVWSQRALNGNGRNLDALLTAGGVALAKEDGNSAKELTLRAISEQPQNGRAWTNLGLAELLSVNLDGAREALARSVKYMPDHIGTWIALGWTQLLQNDIEAAEATFQAALAIDKNFSESHGGLAAVAAMRSDWVSADNHAKTARRLDPTSMAHHFTQILKTSRDGDIQTASLLINKALIQKSSPSGGNLLEMLARVASNRHH